MEDASGTDLDWFWRGWFFTTDYNDIGIKAINRFQVSDQPSEEAIRIARRYGMTAEEFGQRLYLKPMEGEQGLSENPTSVKDIAMVSEYLQDNFSTDERATLKDIKYFYEIVFEKPGGLVMPILAEITYEDGTKEDKYYPAEIWRFNDREVKKVIACEKPIKQIRIDPNQLTADVNLENNSWPREEQESKFDAFKNQTVDQ
jgi:hypothetical protein